MNGMHDLGGMHGMGPINPEPNEPVFHAAVGTHGVRPVHHHLRRRPF